MGRGVLLASGVLFAVGCAKGSGGGPPVDSPAGLHAHREPATGRFIEPAPEVAARAAVTGGLALGESSGGGLSERPTGFPAGGFAVDLGGRFRSYLVARRGEGNRLELHCLPAGVAAGGATGEPPRAAGSSEGRP